MKNKRLLMLVLSFMMFGLISGICENDPNYKPFPLKFVNATAQTIEITYQLKALSGKAPENKSIKLGPKETKDQGAVVMAETTTITVKLINEEGNKNLGGTFVICAGGKNPLPVLTYAGDSRPTGGCGSYTSAYLGVEEKPYHYRIDAKVENYYAGSTGAQGILNHPMYGNSANLQKPNQPIIITLSNLRKQENK